MKVFFDNVIQIAARV